MLRYPILFCLGLSYGIHLVLKFGHIPVPGFFSHYFADLLCMPLLLSFALLSMRWFRGENDRQLPWSMVLVAIVYVSLVFELVLPAFFKRYTSDVWDVVMYGLGGVLFFVFQKHLVPVSKNSLPVS